MNFVYFFILTDFLALIAIGVVATPFSSVDILSDQKNAWIPDTEDDVFQKLYQ